MDRPRSSLGQSIRPRLAIFGACFVALGLFGFASLARGRVWVEGSTLYSRTLRGYGPPIQL